MTDNRPKSPPRRRVICVFCGSSFGRDPAYREAARRFGSLMAGHGFDLVFGGGGVGLMGDVARAVAAGGGKVTGIIPDFLRGVEMPLEIASEMIITESMNERKARMFALADAFVILPGGLGTLDEMTEAFTYAQLGIHAKPVVFVNVKGFFGPFLKLVDHMVAEGFARGEVKTLIHIVATPDEAITLLSRLPTPPRPGAAGVRASRTPAPATRSRRSRREAR